VQAPGLVTGGELLLTLAQRLGLGVQRPELLCLRPTVDGLLGALGSLAASLEA